MTDFAPLSELIRLRSYNRRNADGTRETWDQTVDRTLYSEHLGLKYLGKFTDEEIELIDKYQREKKAFGSARWLWVGGTEWISKPDQIEGAYNCTTTRIIDWDSFGNMMNLAMMGSGTGCSIELKYIDRLAPIHNHLNVTVVGSPGDKPSLEDTRLSISNFADESDQTWTMAYMVVGDSRKGWVSSYQSLIELAANTTLDGHVDVIVDISHIRPAGTPLKGFGGVANPVKLPEMYVKVAEILNDAVGRKLTSLECCLLVDEAASCVVAGNIRRSAGMRQGSSEDKLFTEAKDNLWQEVDGNWIVDPKRDSLRMANHTRVYHHKPTIEECLEAVTKQFYSGEGAIQYAPEAIARGNADLLNSDAKKVEFIKRYELNPEYAKDFLFELQDNLTEGELEHRLSRYEFNPCAEIIGSDLFCNLSSVHLNTLDPLNLKQQEEAFTASALQACAFLQRGFTNPRYQYSRDLDPIVGVSFTGAFTFFVKLFGVDWLRWWEAGRPEFWGESPVSHLYVSQSDYFRTTERKLLTRWKETVRETVTEYCHKHGLKTPNRYTTLKPEGSQTLLTGVGCNGFHPPKSWYYIRRMTFAKNDPIALAAIDYGYTVVPSQSDKDDKGRLLNDPFDPRCTEWLVEVPVMEEIASLYPEASEIKPNKFSALAQFDWMMQCQQYYVTHNVSSTLELTKEEIEPLAERIHQAIKDDEGYVSAALLARFDAPYPRLPFEVVSREEYERLHSEVLKRRKSDDFQALIAKYDNPAIDDTPQDSACSSGACELRMSK